MLSAAALQGGAYLCHLEGGAIFEREQEDNGALGLGVPPRLSQTRRDWAATHPRAPAALSPVLLTGWIRLRVGPLR